MFKKEFVVSNNDVDDSFTLKVSSIYRYFQDVCLLATQDLGIDQISLAKKHIDWVLTRMDVEIKRLPKCNEVINVCTYPGKDLAMLYPRFFYIEDENKEVIIRSASIWALIDSKNRKIIVDRDVISKLPQETTPFELPLPSKIAISENGRFIETRRIHFSDLDFNCHMNNVRYVELLMDTHDYDFHQKYEPAFISLNYIKEIKEKDQVDIYTDESQPETIEVKVNGVTSFVSKITYIEK